MATGTLIYGSASTVAFTSLAALTNGSGAQSAAVDNTGTLAIDYQIRITALMSANTPTGTLDFFVAGLVNSSTPTYTDGATGTDATFTAANRVNAPLLWNMTMRSGASMPAVVLLSSIPQFRKPPSKFSLIAINNTGFTLGTGSSNFVVEVVPITVSVA
jgi:hypothetical protein